MDFFFLISIPKGGNKFMYQVATPPSPPTGCTDHLNFKERHQPPANQVTSNRTSRHDVLSHHRTVSRGLWGGREGVGGGGGVGGG